MRTLFKYLFVGFALTVLSSCWQDCYIDIEQEVATDEVVYNVVNTGETITIPIRCNTDWFIWNPPYWIIPEVESGSGDYELSVEVSRNASYERTGELNIIAGTEVKTVTIKQGIATSGRLSVATSSCYASRQTQTLHASIYITSAHLASEAGVIVDGKTYKLNTTLKEGFNDIEVSKIKLGGTCQAYAKNKYTGMYVYGEILSYSIF